MANGDARLLNEELEAQSKWMRRLVRKLVSDGAGVDDVVQEAQLAALKRERAGEAVGRGWLARVAVNFARKRHRDDASRRAIERDAARAEALPPADELVARLDAQRELANELRALPEPYRSTLVRRFFDNWSAARIAREAGCPASTVRTRLERGLDLLRERLDRRHDGRRSDWLAALAPLALPRVPPWLDLPSAPVSKFLQGVVVMKVGLQIAAVCAALVVVGVGWLWRDAAPDAASPTASLPAARPAIVEAPAVSAAATESSRTASPAAIAAPLASAAESAQVAVVVEPTRITARIVDVGLFPIAKAKLSWADEDDAPTAVTNFEGRATLEAPPQFSEVRANLRIEAEGFALKRLEVALQPNATVSIGDVALERAARISGRVQHVDGRPVRDALVLATAPSLWGVDLDSAKRCGPAERENGPSTRSLADGAFLLESIEPGGVRVWAQVDGMRFGVSEPIVVQAEALVEGVVLVVEELKPEDEIAGHVLDPDGLPAVGASLQIVSREGGSSYSWSQALDSDGAFRFRVRQSTPHDLRAQDGRGRWTEVALEGVAPGEHDAILRFEPTRFLSVTAQAADGAQVERMALRTFDSHGDELLESVPISHSADGGNRIRVPGRTFLVECAAPGFALARLGPFEHRSAPTELEFRLEPSPGITGRVLANGAPVASARVTLWRMTSGSNHVEIGGYPALRDPRVADETLTDSDGAYFLRVDRAGAFVVRAEAAGFVAAESEAIDAAPRVARGGLDLQLGHGGALEGRVLVAPGRNDEGVVVVINRGDGYARSTRSGAGGAFAFENLMPGRWCVQRGRTEISGDPFGNWAISDANEGAKLEFNCDVLEGATTQFDLDLRDDAPAILRGRLLLDGKPANAWTLTVWPGDRNSYSGELPSTALDEHGEFVIAIDEAGPARLSFAWPIERGERGAFETVVELQRGENPWSHDIPTTRLTGRSSRPSSDTYALFLRIDAAQVKASLPLHTAPDGSFDLPLAPLGHAKIYGAPVVDHQWGDSELLREFDLTRGSPASIEF